MGSIGSFSVPNLTFNGGISPTIGNVTCVLADTEYSYTVPSGCKGFILKARTKGILKLAYILGDSGSTYYTVWPYGFHSVGELSLTSAVTLYFQSPTAGTIVEIEYWI